MLSDAEQARGLRPVRPRRRRPAAWAAAAARRRLRRLRRRLRRHLRRHLRRRRAAGAAPCSAAPTCATTSRSRSRRRRAAPRPRSASRRWETCETCKGTRRQARHAARAPAPPATATARCACAQGFFSIQQTCPHCHGSGKIIPDPCAHLRTAPGRIKKHKTLSVKIPAGVDEGDRIRLVRRRRGRRQRRPAGRPLRRDPHQAARGLPARRRRPALRDADQLHHGRARRRDRDPDARRLRPRSRCPPRRRPARCSACAARASRACAQPARRPVLPRRGRDAGQA